MLDVSSTDKGLLIPRMTTTQKDAIPNKTEGLTVYDTDLKQFSYWTIDAAFGSWKNFGGATGSTGGEWSLGGADISNTNVGNVGVGITNPIRAKFEVAGMPINSLTSALFAGETSGISMQGNWPTIGFNQYRDLPTGYGKAMADGFGVNMNMNPANGALSVLMMQNALAGQEIPGQKIAMNIFANGKTHFGDNNISDQATLSISGQNNFPSHFNYGTNGHTYIRGGSRTNAFFLGNALTPSKVYINDIDGVDDTVFPTQTGRKGGDVILATGGGNVGVGVDNPKSKLSFANVLGNKINLWHVSNTSEYGIGIQNGTFQIYTAGQDQIAFGYGNSANFNKTMTYYPGTAQLGINTLPVPGYHLSVKGIAKFQELVVEVANWPDYVFDEKYKLPSLESVAQQIKVNKHLAGLPKASEIETNGLKVGEVQRKMMEKIEELTLYILELKGEIDLLKNKN
jgi:hypothetical protein